VTPANTALTSEELFSDDNKSLTNSLHEAVNEFGTLSDINFGTRANVVLHYNGKSAAGDAGLVTWTMKGSGSGTVVLDAQHLTASLTTQGTTIASSVTSAFSKTGAHLALTSISFNDAVGTVALGNANVSGLAVFSGGVKTLALGDLTNQALLLIGAVLPDTSTKGTITLGNVTDFSLESDMPLTSLTATSWHDTAGTAKDTITAPSIGTLKVNGDLEANVTLSDDLATTAITVAGSLHNSTITTAGNLSAVTLGAIDTSSVFAGVTARPTSLSAFANPKTIASFTITGYAGHTTNLFANSQVAAQTIGSIKVKAVTPTGTGTYGFVADVIKSYSRTATPGHPDFTRSNLSAPLVVDNLGNYEVQIL
jgi:hypothetical protein